MGDAMRDKEIREAIQAGERALKSLREAERRLSSAGSWGIVDILGGGLITSAVKHSKIDAASSYLNEAKADMRVFQRELKDIPDMDGLGIDIGGFLTFADFFFDGLIADCMVQSRIRDAQNRVSSAAGRVEAMLRKLRAMD